MFAKFINETQIEKAPNCINANGSIIVNPSKEQYAAGGYYEVIEAEKPEKRKWYDIVVKYTLLDGEEGSYTIYKTDEEDYTTKETFFVELKTIQKSYEYVKQPQPNYSDLTVGYIRETYSINDEIAILRQKDSGAKKSDFDDYNTYCEECKQRASKDIEEWEKA